MYDSAKALNCAIEEWSRGIIEPTNNAQNGAERIDAYIRDAQGLGWPSAALTQKDSTAYTRNGQFQWCGAFAAWCLGAAGLDRSVRRSRLPSTYRLRSQEAHLGPALPRRALGELHPGDVLVVGSDAGPVWGEHIALVFALDRAAQLAYTVEGNARGVLPGGAVAEGVVMRTRPLVRPEAGALCPVSGLRHGMWAMWAYGPG